VLFVQAVAEHGSDKKLVKERRAFNRKLWKPPVVQPLGRDTNGTKVCLERVELRATDLDQPTILDANIGWLADGRFAIRLELNGVAMSIAFADPRVYMTRSGPLGDREWASEATGSIDSDGTNPEL
jgi:hypothetical protein